MNIHITIDDVEAEKRLDMMISSRFSGLSRSRTAGLIKEGQIRVNGQIKKPGYRLKSGDRIIGDVASRMPDLKITAEQAALEIIYEDAHLIVVNKKPGMIVHPGSGNFTGTLVNALIAHVPEIRHVGEDPLRAGIVHRLDKDTSGVMVVAKTTQALTFLQKEFKQRRVQKRYLALVHGVIAEDNGRIDLPIGRHPVKRKQMAVNVKTGKPAVSTWTVVRRFETATLVAVTLETGRTHQIRVHFYAQNHPLVGERIYQFRSKRKKSSAAPRQMLHSCKLSFRHPFSGKRICFEAKPPNDFSSMIDTFEHK